MGARKFAKRLSKVDVAAVIDRLFRFLEMSFLAALLGLVYSTVDPEWAFFVTMLMSLGAGFYLAIPLLKWMGGDKLRKVDLAIYSVGFGFSAATLILPTQALVRATFDIDESAAVREYAQIQGRFAGMACARRGHYPPEECEVEAKKIEDEILRRHASDRHDLNPQHGYFGN